MEQNALEVEHMHLGEDQPEQVAALQAERELTQTHDISVRLEYIGAGAGKATLRAATTWDARGRGGSSANGWAVHGPGVRGERPVE